MRYSKISDCFYRLFVLVADFCEYLLQVIKEILWRISERMFLFCYFDFFTMKSTYLVTYVHGKISKFLDYDVFIILSTQAYSSVKSLSIAGISSFFTLIPITLWPFESRFFMNNIFRTIKDFFTFYTLLLKMPRCIIII